MSTQEPKPAQTRTYDRDNPAPAWLIAVCREMEDAARRVLRHFAYDWDAEDTYDKPRVRVQHAVDHIAGNHPVEVVEVYVGGSRYEKSIRMARASIRVRNKEDGRMIAIALNVEAVDEIVDEEPVAA